MLSRNINKRDDPARVMIVEDGGLPITRGLKAGDPSKSKMNYVYGDSQCIVSPNHRCDQSGEVYKLQCKDCNTVIEEDNSMTRREADMRKPSYVGLTRTTAHSRMASHLKSRKYKYNSSPMWRHDRDAHGGIPQEYTCKIIGQERKIVRLHTREALEIERLGIGQKLNSREECGRGAIVRISAQRHIT